ncbi:MAG: glycosyltransferase family 2 protein [Steroidobacteraceae bacterium]
MNGSRTARAPRFSIVTATFNAGAALARTLASIRAQSVREFEWIVVDGGSSDGSLALIRGAPDVVSDWISEPDEGIADAWNKGLALAAGRFALVLNAGDTYDADFLEKISSYCDDDHIACAHARLASPEGKVLGIFRSQPQKLNRGMYVAHNWCAVPMALYRKFGPYVKLPLAMDFEWFHRYYRSAGTRGFRVLDAVLGTYCLGGASDSRFKESFRATERVRVEHGANPFLARADTWRLCAKHFVRHRILRQ